MNLSFVLDCELSHGCSIVCFTCWPCELICFRLSHQKLSLEASPENSSEDLVANDLSDNDVVDDDDDDDEGRDK